MKLGPLFKWFGSKWLSAKKYPAPIHASIFEPYGGGAGYSLNYAEKQVVICEIDVHLSKLWPWLIYEAKESDIRDIPINLEVGTDIRNLGLSEGQSLLLKSWQRTNNVGDCWTISPWGNKPGQWTANTRARVAEEVCAIKHWQFSHDAFSLMRSRKEGTWFVDPMYEYNYQYKCAPINYGELSALVEDLRGQVIVCEAVCSKTGKVPNWLPFAPFAKTITSRRKKNENHHSSELIWYSPKRNPLPPDYEECGTCGYDHAYDFPYLASTEMERVKKLHSTD